MYIQVKESLWNNLILGPLSFCLAQSRDTLNTKLKGCLRTQAPFHIYVYQFFSGSGIHYIRVGMPIWMVCLYQPFLTFASISWLAGCAKKRITPRFPKQLVPRVFSLWGTLWVEFSRDQKRNSLLQHFVVTQILSSCFSTMESTRYTHGTEPGFIKDWEHFELYSIQDWLPWTSALACDHAEALEECSTTFGSK